MPRRGPDKGSKGRSSRSDGSGPPERPRGPGRKPPTGYTDEQVLSLRESGESYSAIARGLELRRAVDAHQAFIRAIGRREGEERRQLVMRESSRLDALERRIRERDASDPDKVARRILGVDHLREALQ